MSFLDSPIFDDAQREHDTPPSWLEDEEDTDDIEDEDLDDDEELNLGDLLVEVFDYDKGEIDDEIVLREEDE